MIDLYIYLLVKLLNGTKLNETDCVKWVAQLPSRRSLRPPCRAAAPSRARRPGARGSCTNGLPRTACQAARRRQRLTTVAKCPSKNECKAWANRTSQSPPPFPLSLSLSLTRVGNAHCHRDEACGRREGSASCGGGRRPPALRAGPRSVWRRAGRRAGSW